ncbi:MAG: YrbL family protein [Synergistota bacterium]|nr:YrbL family protein [Synergistota bacterium]
MHRNERAGFQDLFAQHCVEITGASNNEEKEKNLDSREIWEIIFEPLYGFREFILDLFGTPPSTPKIPACFRNRTILQLNPVLFIGSGCNRFCYSFPGRPDLCIKIDRPINGSPNNSRRMRLKKYILPWLYSISCNRDEADFYFTKAPSLGEVLYLHAPRCFGIAFTNLGPGLVLERIRNHDGTPSLLLADNPFDRPDSVEHIMSLIDELYAFLRRNDLVLFCWNPDNVVLRHDPQGIEHLVAIDWKSESRPNDDLPFSSMCRFLARKKMEKKVLELKEWVIDHGR